MQHTSCCPHGRVCWAQQQHGVLFVQRGGEPSQPQCPVTATVMGAAVKVAVLAVAGWRVVVLTVANGVVVGRVVKSSHGAVAGVRRCIGPWLEVAAWLSGLMELLCAQATVGWAWYSAVVLQW